MSSRSIRFRNECAAISAPRLVPHPTCTFPKKICCSERALLPAYLDAIRLSVLPMAIGLNPPCIFMGAISIAPKKKGLRGSGILPSPMRFISLVSDFRELSPPLPFDFLTRSLKIWGNILSGPAADPFGKDIIALYGSKSVTKNYPNFLGLELQIRLAEGAYTTIFDGYELKKEQFCHPKQQALFLPLHFLRRAYYLLALFSTRGHTEAGLKLGDGVLEVTRNLLETFLFIKELMLVVCLRPLLFGFFKKSRTTLEKLAVL